VVTNILKVLRALARHPQVSVCIDLQLISWPNILLAETIAMAAKKPLFPVNVADVGTKAKYVEANLEKIFDLATTWEAILLM